MSKSIIIFLLVIYTWEYSFSNNTPSNGIKYLAINSKLLFKTIGYNYAYIAEHTRYINIEKYIDPIIKITNQLGKLLTSPIGFFEGHYRKVISSEYKNIIFFGGGILILVSYGIIYFIKRI